MNEGLGLVELCKATIFMDSFEVGNSQGCYTYSFPSADTDITSMKMTSYLECYQVQVVSGNATMKCD